MKYKHKKKCNHKFDEIIRILPKRLFQIDDSYIINGYGSLISECDKCKESIDEMIVGGIIFGVNRGE